MTNPCGEDGIRRLLLAQERLQQVIRQEVQGWLDELWRGTYNGDSFLRFVTALGLDLSPIPTLGGNREASILRGFEFGRSVLMRKSEAGTRDCL